MDLSTLHVKRKIYVESARENNFEEGLLNLLTELYPDNAHFIYELLQNAEDAGATKILFELKNNKLIFSHNGTRAFNIKDVESITSIGNSTKKDDINTIGKFGVGFKAVFSYTKAPRIYSKDICFEIIDLFIPRLITPIHIDKEYTTKIIFPFNNESKAADRAFKEVAEHLDNLSDLTLLFLSNINEIIWNISENISSLKRFIDATNQIHIHNTKSNSTSHWLKYKKYLNTSNKLYVAIAYALKKNEKDIFEIIPTDGTVSIFFPAEKETSKLKFHIHAPFMSTVARDSIKNLPENTALIHDIAILTAESFFDIKNKGMLNIDFLHVLPFPDDYITNLYMPIQKKIFDIFQEEDFLPTESGDFTNAKYCYSTPSDIKRVIKREDLAILINKNIANIYFVKSPSMIQSRAGKFIQSLKIDKWEWKEFGDAIRNLNDEMHSQGKDSIKSKWIENKSMEWVQAFYALLLDALRKHEICFQEEIHKKVIYPLSSLIKLENHFNYKQNDIYFTNENKSLQDVKYVNYSTFNSGSNKKQKEKAKQFLIELGVKEVTEKEQIKLLLEDKYTYSTHNEDATKLNNIKHIKRFLDYQIDGNNMSFMSEYKFLLSTNADHKQWVRAQDIYIDEPYKKTGMTSLSTELNLKKLDDIYLELKSDENFIELLKQLGARYQLKIDEVNIFFNPDCSKLTNNGSIKKTTTKTINIDYTINNINQILDHCNLELSLLIWNTLCAVSSSVLRASFKQNGKAELRTADSQLVHSLKNHTWIPSKNGQFYKPQEITQNQLHHTIVYNNSNGWLDAIGFGENIEKEKETYKEKEAFAQELGFESLDELDILKQLTKQYSIDQLKDLINKPKIDTEKRTKTLRESVSYYKSDGESKPFHESNESGIVIKNEEKHQENIHQENIATTNTFTKSNKTIKTQNKDEIININQFLYEEYEGHCQVCGDTFADGNNNISKSKSLNFGKNRDINRKGNTISLCHKHWEIFNRDLVGHSYLKRIEHQEILSLEFMDNNYGIFDWVSKDDVNEKDDAFYMLDMEDSFSRDGLYFFPIKVFSKEKYIKFTKTHIMAFIDVWNNY